MTAAPAPATAARGPFRRAGRCRGRRPKRGLWRRCAGTGRGSGRGATRSGSGSWPPGRATGGATSPRSWAGRPTAGAPGPLPAWGGGGLKRLFGGGRREFVKQEEVAVAKKLKRPPGCFSASVRVFGNTSSVYVVGRQCGRFMGRHRHYGEVVEPHHG
jgi:hypothetical protein